MDKRKIAIFASGGGTNAEQIIKYFDGHPDIEVAGVYTNNPKAGVISRLESYTVPVKVFNRRELYETDSVCQQLIEDQIKAVILAGFLWLVPPQLITAVSGNMLNIHPALLPKYGGAGMYGMNVHKAVIAAGEPYSGITIHLVNEEYDKGEVLFQAKCPVEPHDTPETLAKKIHQLEYKHFAPQIEKWLSNGR